MTAAMRNLRFFVAIVVVVGFNVLMVVLAAIGRGSIEPSFFVAWFGGDFALGLLALAVTDVPKD
jgi:hypothetical protein